MRMRPSDDKEFEKLVRDVVAGEYQEHYELYGRNGQNQHGADVVSQSREIVVQCKCYDINNAASSNLLIKSIQHDFPAACAHPDFQDMRVFIVATTLSCDNKVQDAFTKLQQEERQKSGRLVEIHTLFWEDIEDLCKKHETRTANREYAKDFEAPMFLHKNVPSVCLKNLFVQPDYDVIRPVDAGPSAQDLYHFLSEFITNAKEQLLIIEGDAGNGKTTLAKALCWNHQKDTATAQAVLQGRPLVTVRLRDLKKPLISREEGMLPAILDYLHIEDAAAFNRRFPGAVLILDGYDELCIIEGISDTDRLLYRLSLSDFPDCKVIVTSRPNYIHREINLSLSIISLRHFDREKRKEWLERFTGPTSCQQEVLGDLQKYLIEAPEEGACDTPLMLYLIASNQVPTEWLNNPWKVYQHIFSKEIIERSYENKPHPGFVYADTVYQIAEEIAFSMFCSPEDAFFLENEEILKIVCRLTNRSFETEEKDVRQLVSRSTALCSYWKTAGVRGAVEFYHNNIRDFFLCEKIYRTLNTVYADHHLARKEKVSQLIIFFRDNFRSRRIAWKACHFIYLRAKHHASEAAHDNPDFPVQEREQDLLPLLFERLLSDRAVMANMDNPPTIAEMANILGSIAQIYRAALDPLLQKDELISWWDDVDTANKCQALLYLFPAIFEDRQPPDAAWANPGTRGDFAEIDLHSLSFGKRSFEVPGLAGASFRTARLENADLQYCYLENVNFQYADLSSAYLVHAELSGAKLQFAELSQADLSHACLRHTDLEGADLHGANLQYTDFRHANLSRANLVGAKLEHAVLPDGSHSAFYAEQKMRLMAMNIPGLKI